MNGAMQIDYWICVTLSKSKFKSFKGVELTSFLRLLIYNLKIIKILNTHVV